MRSLPPGKVTSLFCLVVAGLLPASGSAHAEAPSSTVPELVKNGQFRAVIATPASRLVVNKPTAGITVFSKHGRRVLGTAPVNAVDRSRAPTPDDVADPNYSGFGFTVGPEPELAYPVPGGDPEPPPQPEPAQGDGRYRATKVLAIKVHDDRIRLVLASDDPAGRKIRLDISPSQDQRLRLRPLVSPDRRVTAVSASFAAGRAEAFHGFGGRRESTDLRGADFKTWVFDYRFPDASGSYYAPYPGFISSRGYSFRLAGGRIGRWRMASDRDRAWRVSAAGSRMGLSLQPFRAARSIGALSRVTGRHRVPPDWSTGPTLSRSIGILVDQDPGVYREKVESDLARIAEGDLEVTAYAFEGWATLPTDFVRRTVRHLRKMGIRTILYLRSFVANDTAGTEPPGVFETAIEKGYTATHADGSPYLIPSPFPGGEAAVIDFTNPDAARWWAKRVAKLLDTGARGFMNDFGEQVQPDMHFADGSTGASMHNRYPKFQAFHTRQAINAWQRSHRRAEVYFFQRAGFSGSWGSAGWENAQFPGDETVDWDPDTGLPSIIPDMLNRAVTGAAGFTTDIGGYAQFSREHPIMPPTDAELFTRWAEAAVFTPFYRVHNSGLDGVRMPWDFDQKTLNRWNRTVNIHDRARPLIKRLWKKFVRTGVPMTRPMWLVDPKGARGPRGDDQWLLGNNLLAAPIVVEDADSRPVRLPPGCWRLHGKGGKLKGGRTIEVSAPLGTLPWFTRCGTRPLGG